VCRGRNGRTTLGHYGVFYISVERVVGKSVNHRDPSLAYAQYAGAATTTIIYPDASKVGRLLNKKKNERKILA